MSGRIVIAVLAVGVLTTLVSSCGKDPAEMLEAARPTATLERAAAATTAMPTIDSRTIVPPLIGLRLTDARDAAGRSDLRVEATFIIPEEAGALEVPPEDDFANWIVVTQRPHAGDRIDDGENMTVEVERQASAPPYVFPPEVLLQDALDEAGLTYDYASALVLCDLLRSGGLPADPATGSRGQTPGEYLAETEDVGSGSENEQAIGLAIQYLCPGQQYAFDNAKSGNYSVAPPLAQFGPGVWVVGEDIQPGTYRTQGQVSDCYWARLTAGGDIIDNSFISAALQAIVIVQPSDALVESSGCGTWTKDG